MKQKPIYFFLCAFVAACAPTTTFPTSTPTAIATQTATPAPTSTMSPTLEPWMRSLPENVASVEREGDAILGLDAEGNPVMEFNSENEDWVEVGGKKAFEDYFRLNTMDKIDHVKVGGSGVEVNGGFVIERSLGTFDVDFTDELGSKTLAEFVANYIYSHGANPQSGEPSSTDIANIERLMSDVQKGSPDHPASEVVVNIPVLDVSNPDGGYVFKKVIFFPGNADLTGLDDVTVINSLDVMYPRGFVVSPDGTKISVNKEILGMNLTDPGGGIGFGVVLDGDALWLEASPDYLFSSDTRDIRIGLSTILLKDFVRRFDGHGLRLTPSREAINDSELLASSGISTHQ